MKKITIAIVLVIAIVFTIILLWRLPSDWREKLLFPIKMPDVVTTAKTNNSDTHHFDEKIWLHRVNSIERAKLMQDNYIGFEIDIIWDSDSCLFYIAHDPHPEIYVTLENYFDNINNCHGRYFWLDFKNLNEENLVLALEYLLKLTKKHNIDIKNVIVESMSPDILSNFTTAGFSTSFYLPIWDFNPYTSTETEITEYAKLIDSLLQNSNVNYLSSDFLSYHFIKKYFPDSHFLLWHLKESRLTPYVRKKLTKDKNVKVILTHEISEGYW